MNIINFDGKMLYRRVDTTDANIYVNLNDMLRTLVIYILIIFYYLLVVAVVNTRMNFSEE